MVPAAPVFALIFTRRSWLAAHLPGGAGVPVAMTVRLTPNLVRMCGTDAQPPRCVALAGEIGRAVQCTIYAERPSPCREFDTEHEACQRARRYFGLP